MNHDSNENFANDRHYASTGYVFNPLSSQFLMIFHKKLHKWMPPGGHIKIGEEPHEAALREVYEETGVRGRILELPNLKTKIAFKNVFHLPLPFCILREKIPLFGNEQAHEHINFVYIVLVDQPFSIKLLQDEAFDFQWVSLDSINKLDTFDTIKELCKIIHKSLSKYSKY